MPAKYPSEIVIALENTKQAALYFDSVIDLSMVQPAEKWINDFPAGLGRELAPPALRDSEDFFVDLARLGLMWHIADQVKDGKRRKEFLKELKFLSAKKGDYKNLPALTVAYFLVFLNNYGLVDAPIQAPNSRIESDDTSEDVALTLLNANMIDTSNCSWDQILEFRKDIDARHKLRRLRLFAFENYLGKSKEYVKEDIARRIEEANDAARTWGFETKTNALSMLLTSKILAGGTAGSFVSILAGEPLTAILSVAGGVAIEAGRIGVEIRKRQFTLRNMLKNNPVLFYPYAESKLKTRETT